MRLPTTHGEIYHYMRLPTTHGEIYHHMIFPTTHGEIYHHMIFPATHGEIYHYMRFPTTHGEIYHHMRLPTTYGEIYHHMRLPTTPEFLKFVRPIRPRGQKIMRSANNVGNAGPHVCQTFLNDVFTFLMEVGNAGRIVNTGTNLVNS